MISGFKYRIVGWRLLWCLGLFWRLYVIQAMWLPSRWPLEGSNRFRVCEP
jgi:hypothetical protein